MTNPYVAKMVAFTEGKDPIEMQREMPGILSQIIQGVPEKELRRSRHRESGRSARSSHILPTARS